MVVRKAISPCRLSRPELPAVLRIFGSLTEDEGLGLGLILGITALFMATTFVSASCTRRTRYDALFQDPRHQSINWGLFILSLFDIVFS